MHSSVLLQPVCEEMHSSVLLQSASDMRSSVLLQPAEDVIDSPHDKENDIDQDALALSDNDVDVGDDELSEISEESEHGDFTPTI